MASSSHLLASKLFSVKGLTAVVTGGGTGIGLMATQALLANGAKTVYITGRRKEVLENVQKTYGSHGDGEIVPLQGDVTNKDDIKRWVEAVKSKSGGLHILINNAGISGEVTKLDKLNSAQDYADAHMTEQTFEGWDEVYRINSASGFFVSMAFLPLLDRFSKGRDPAGAALHKTWSSSIINIASISGIVKKAQNHFAYNSSKAAANHLTKMLSTEVGAKFNLRINAIGPGVFPSEMTGSGSDDKNKTSLENQFDPSGLGVVAERAGEEEDMAATILYLATNQYVYGQVVVVDGGVLTTNPSTL